MRLYFPFIVHRPTITIQPWKAMEHRPVYYMCAVRDMQANGQTSQDERQRMTSIRSQSVCQPSGTDRAAAILLDIFKEGQMQGGSADGIHGVACRFLVRLKVLSNIHPYTIYTCQSSAISAGSNGRWGPAGTLRSDSKASESSQKTKARQHQTQGKRGRREGARRAPYQKPQILSNTREKCQPQGRRKSGCWNFFFPLFVLFWGDEWSDIGPLDSQVGNWGLYLFPCKWTSLAVCRCLEWSLLFWTFLSLSFPFGNA